MAFRAPTNHRHLSIQSLPHQDEDFQAEADHSPLLSSHGHSPAVEQDADEWVVFSPSSVGDATTVTGTNPLSRISESGSIGSAPRILRHGGNYAIPGTFNDLIEDSEEDEDEDDYLDGTETDSLQPFREQDNQGPIMLPTHDGLGTFPSSSGVISGLRSLEESLRIVTMAGQSQGAENTDSKIRRWQIEHSQALLDEIEKVTRRRISLASLRGGNLGQHEKNLLEEEAIFMGTSAEGPKSSESTLAQGYAEGETEESSETFWRRITRRFIRDIMGIDDQLLQVIFGEALPVETPIPFLHGGSGVSKDAEERLLNRLAKELGVLANHYTCHPSGDGAFSTHRTNLGDYSDDDGSKTPQARSPQLQQDGHTVSPPARQRSQSLDSSSSSVPQFQFAPTLLQEEVSHAALWGIEEEHDTDEETQAKRESQFRKEYWEQELGVRVFFSFLASRFSGPATPDPPPPIASVHQHHPLIRSNCPAFHPYQSQAAKRPVSVVSTKLAQSTATASTSGSRFFGAGFGFGMRNGTSYASAGKGKTVSSRGSSRNRGFYWDVATSVGSGKSGSCIGTGVWAAL
ncbi:hypothetical protein Q9L58_006796 [Maublancomyces gigas]|uniref:Uncharacterized protein n=1 Tax=Discina gigas TaxID=1032678 RepID=A0ABR3GEB3_9PEZI